MIYAVSETPLRSTSVTCRLAGEVPEREAGGRHPIMLAMSTHLLLPMAMMVGVHICLRRHNLPGGGFVAGLIFAIAYLMQYMASGYVWSHARQRYDHHALIGWGVMIAMLSGVGAWAFGLPFLSSGFEHVTLWPLEELELATAAIFDLGVFLSVLGAGLLALASLSRLAQRTGDSASTRACDTDPGEGDR